MTDKEKIERLEELVEHYDLLIDAYKGKIKQLEGG